jgi:hypothetical protein
VIDIGERLGSGGFDADLVAEGFEFADESTLAASGLSIRRTLLCCVKSPKQIFRLSGCGLVTAGWIWECGVGELG